MADYMAGKKPQGRIQEASQSVGSIATINKEPLIGLMKGSESGGYLLSHNAVQYHRRCCLSALCPLSAALASLRPLSRARAPQARTAHTPHGSLSAHTAPHSATPPPMRHTRGGKRRLFLPGQKRYGLSQKRSIGLSFFRATAGRARVIRVKRVMGLEFMTGGKFEMTLNDSKIKMGVAYE